MFLALVCKNNAKCYIFKVFFYILASKDVLNESVVNNIYTPRTPKIDQGCIANLFPNQACLKFIAIIVGLNSTSSKVTNDIYLPTSAVIILKQNLISISYLLELNFQKVLLHKCLPLSSYKMWCANIAKSMHQWTQCSQVNQEKSKGMFQVYNAAYIR